MLFGRALPLKLTNSYHYWTVSYASGPVLTATHKEDIIVICSLRVRKMTLDQVRAYQWQSWMSSVWLQIPPPH